MSQKGNSIWVIVVEYNDYDQHGSYLCGFFHKKPTAQQIKELLAISDGEADHIAKGGGRISDTEEHWWSLHELEEGEFFYD